MEPHLKKNLLPAFSSVKWASFGQYAGPGGQKDLKPTATHLMN